LNDQQNENIVNDFLDTTFVFFLPKSWEIKKTHAHKNMGHHHPQITLIRSFMIFLKTNQMKPQQYGWHLIALIITLVNDLKTNKTDECATIWMTSTHSY
jgi:hypothetical protein